MRGKHPCKETMLFANLLDIYTRKMLVRRQCRTVRLFTPFAFPKKPSDREKHTVQNIASSHHSRARDELASHLLR